MTFSCSGSPNAALSSMTLVEVLQSLDATNSLWIALAQQFIAANINIELGAIPSAATQNDIDAANSLLAYCDGFTADEEVRIPNFLLISRFKLRKLSKTWPHGTVVLQNRPPATTIGVAKPYLLHGPLAMSFVGVEQASGLNSVLALDTTIPTLSTALLMDL